ncbi:lytic transglycosylase domain-containing protein [Frankia sp. AgPm24]|uniref:lytic transglycosylase domain-containing protein n=1 Tax=Frankia sp. AgPm24 TaxID=631128 RepID=UPI00200FC921|nr:lytic transglycosylase domain-containing protein [Frankia sp. AgPm24]MCK9922154.1 lytic transglycosylase domain-containing protein [Frankia sp. AgPm24]
MPARAIIAVVLTIVALSTSVGCDVLRRNRHVPADLVPVFQAAVARYGGGLTAAQLAAQARVESRFNPRAVSHAGAQGIMQFLPATWREVGLDGNQDGRADPMDPHDAIPTAAYYESRLARQVAGLPGDRISLILAAYNAGPDAVRTAGGIPDIGETRHYVARVHDWASTYADQL